MQPVSKLFIWSEGQDRSLMKNSRDVVSKTYISRLDNIINVKMRKKFVPSFDTIFNGNGTAGDRIFDLIKTVLDCQL